MSALLGKEKTYGFMEYFNQNKYAKFSWVKIQS